ncbi:MAG: DUF2634 domain-containing protein [Baekduia sp.]
MSSFDTGYTLVPADDVLTADQQLGAALSGLVPTANPDVPRPLGRGWAMDSETGELVMRGNAPAEVSGVDQLMVWMEKTLRTARLAHPIYSDSYGADNPFGEVGFQFTPGLAGILIKRITDALLVHDRITAVKDFIFNGAPDDEVLLVNFTVVLDEETEIPFSHTVGARSS